MHPLRRFLDAQVIEHQDVGLEHGPQHFHFGLVDRPVVGFAHQAQQFSGLKEEAARALVANHGAQQADGQVGLADPGWPVEHEALLLRREGLDELLG